MTLRLRSSNNFGDPLGRIETPPSRMSLLYCIIYADVNNLVDFSVRITAEGILNSFHTEP